MTPAQIARRKFKSSLPRKPQNRRPSVMEALGSLFTLLDQFAGCIAEQGQDPDQTLHAALAYHLPETDPGRVAKIATLPERSGLGKFCDEVAALPGPVFLGVVFVQVDPDAEKQAYKAVSFCVPFAGTPEDAGRLLTAQKECLYEIEQIAKALRR
jgi:hypothetical protein